MLTKNERHEVKAYRLWAVLMAEDHARCDYELRVQNCLDLHNAHVHALHVRNYNTCFNAMNDKAAELKLYPQ